jgi:hypothetical protein
LSRLFRVCDASAEFAGKWSFFSGSGGQERLNTTFKRTILFAGGIWHGKSEIVSVWSVKSAFLGHW